MADNKNAQNNAKSVDVGEQIKNRVEKLKTLQQDGRDLSPASGRGRPHHLSEKPGILL